MFICKTCGKEFSSKEKLGGHRSACGIIRSKRKSGEKIIRVYRNCINCGNNITTRNTLKYCSTKCQDEFQYKEYIKKWKKGEVSGLKGENSSPQISWHVRHYLFEKFNNKCATPKCGWGEMNPTTKKIPLEVEHIDGNSTNNKEENLTLLCPNCHSLTPTYRGANKGNGRHYRRLQYHKEQKMYNGAIA